MGDVVKGQRRASGLGQAMAVFALSAVLVMACASTSARGASATADERTTSRQPVAPAPAGPEIAPPIAIESIEVREGAPGMVVDVAATGAMLYTSFRDVDGSLVIELPNSVADEGVGSVYENGGLVSKVTVEQLDSGSRPLTRMKVFTRAEVEHSLASEGNVLRLSLLPLGAEEPALTYEPLPEEAQPAEAVPAEAMSAPQAEPAEPRRVERGDLGTPEDPRLSAPPVGPVATRLDAVQGLDGNAILVEGDGEFLYSTFVLDSPSRFVIDLNGVVDTSDRSTLALDSGLVKRVRVAQFKPFPEPVSRVVFDLEGDAVPEIERTSQGLIVRFYPAGAELPATQVAAVEKTSPQTPPPPVETVAYEPPPEVEPVETHAEPEPMVAEATPESYPTETYEAEAEPEADSYAVDSYEDEPVVETYTEPAPTAGQVPTVTVNGEPLRFDSGESAPQREAFRSPQVEPEAPAPFEVADDGEDLFESEGGSDEELGPPGQRSVFTTKVFGGQEIAGGEKIYSGDPINMSLRDADVVETLRSFAAISGLSVVVQPGVSGSVTVELNNVPWDQALEQILKINLLGYELEGTVMRIAPIQVLEAEARLNKALAQAKSEQVPLRTIMKRLSYASARDVQQLLRSRGGLLSRRGSVLVDRRTNTLIIKELPAFLDVVTAVIEEIDTPEPQVMIEARIIETTKRFTRSLGVDWSVNGEASPRFGNTTGLTFPNNVAGTGGVNLVTGAENGFINLSLGNVLNSFNLDVALRAAENEGLIKILSSPKIAVLNNEQANIQSGLQIPIQTIANNTVTVQFINATLSLDVVPQVTAEGTVLMDINIRKREPQLAFAVVGAANAPIATKEARTRVIVRDGGTTVIGGIYEVTSDQGEDRVPGLANVPLIGHLFKNKRRTDENEELLIFITPRVVNL